MPPRFLYFDLGNVLLNFDNQVACRNMAQLAGITPEAVHQAVFGTKLQDRYETGEIDDRAFYDEFRRLTQTHPSFEGLMLACSQMFTPNLSIFPLVGALHGAGYRLGILSNTCPAHWRYCSQGRYALVQKSFEVHALSFELKACKPSAAIFEGAARLAGIPPQQIFFVDDVPGHVEGARAAGFDAVAYTGTADLDNQLRKRGIDFNY